MLGSRDLASAMEYLRDMPSNVHHDVHNIKPRSIPQLDRGQAGRGRVVREPLERARLDERPAPVAVERAGIVETEFDPGPCAS
jgi:hypothetical protein